MPTIEVNTRWGQLPARYELLNQPAGSTNLVVLFPGRGYTLDAPLMWYAGLAAFDAGYDVLGVEYGYQANRTDLDIEDLDELVDEAVAALKRVMDGKYSNIVFFGKSLGTIVQTKVQEKINVCVQSHVFLTPLRPMIPAIHKTKRSLVIVGDNDNLFDKDDVLQIMDLPNVEAHVIPGANHSLETPDYRESIDILKQTATLCGDFCKHTITDKGANK